MKATRSLRAPAMATGILAIVVIAGCSRNPDDVPLTAPFNDDTELGELTAVWKATGEERSFAHAARLAEPEIEIQYRVDARNDMKEPVFVRLADFQLLSRDGLALVTEQRKVECALAPGRVQGVMAGSVWVTKRAAGDADRFAVHRFAVPLSERGRALYREWLIERRPGEEKAIDAELQAYALAAACTAQAAATK